MALCPAMHHAPPTRDRNWGWKPQNSHLPPLALALAPACPPSSAWAPGGSPQAQSRWMWVRPNSTQQVLGGDGGTQDKKEQQTRLLDPSHLLWMHSFTHTAHPLLGRSFREPQAPLLSPWDISPPPIWSSG